MKLFDILAILVTLSAVFSYFNYRYIRLPTTIGLMLIALVMSLGLIALGPLGLGIEQEVEKLRCRPPIYSHHVVSAVRERGASCGSYASFSDVQPKCGENTDLGWFARGDFRCARALPT